MRPASGRQPSDAEGEMNRWRSQRGEIQVGCIIGAIVLLIAVVVAIKAIPIMMNVYEFKDTIVELADKASTTRYRNKPKKLKQAVKDKADELRIPLSPDNIDITTTNKYVTIEVVFDIEIDFIVHTYVWHQDIKEERPVF